jgi:hypothetical protein
MGSRTLVSGVKALLSLSATSPLVPSSLDPFSVLLMALGVCREDGSSAGRRRRSPDP